MFTHLGKSLGRSCSVKRRSEHLSCPHWRKRRINRCLNRRQDERGLALVLVTIFLAALLAMLALALDGVMYSTTKTEMQLRANQIALGALRGYYDSSSTTPSVKLTSALTAARKVAANGQSVSSQKHLYQDSGNDQSALALAHTGDPSARGSNGRILPGRWYSVEPTPSCASAPTAARCPCGGGAWHGPCFEATSDTDAPNAIRVEYNTDAGSGVRSLFAGVLGKDFFTTSASAIAKVNPRRVVFMFDLSRSSVSVSHGAINGLAQSADGYAFMVDPRFGMSSCTGAPDGSNSSYWLATTVPATNPPIRRLAAEDALKYTNLLAANPSALANYQCFEVPNTGDEGANDPALFATPSGDVAGWNNQIYLIDTTRAPQPLTGILNGIHLALEEFKRRSVKGDMVGVVGFDDKILPSRASLVEPWTGSGDAFTVGMVRTDIDDPASEFEKLRIATDTSTSLQTRLNKKFLIPRAYGGMLDSTEPYPYNRQPAASDIARAMEIGLQMLLYGYQRSGLPANRSSWPAPSNEVKQAENMLIVLSDFIANCGNYNAATGALVYSASNLETSNRQCAPGASPWFQTGYFTVGTNEVNAVIGAYASRSMPIYMLHFPARFSRWVNGSVQSASSLPGNRLVVDRWRGQGQKCMSEDNASYYALAPVSSYSFCGGGIRLVSGGDYAWTDAHGTSPMSLHAPHNLNRAVWGTGGQYIPIKRPCVYPIGGVSCAVHGQLPAIADTECATAAAGADDCRSAYYAPASPSATFLNTIDPGVTRNIGMYYCDLACRSQEQQVVDLVTKLMKNNPYVLVEE